MIHHLLSIWYLMQVVVIWRNPYNCRYCLYWKSCQLKISLQWSEVQNFYWLAMTSPVFAKSTALPKALAHYNWNHKKSRYRPYTLQLFFTTATIFSAVLYMDNDFHKDFFWKIVEKIFIVCEGLKPLLVMASDNSTIRQPDYAISLL